jgi:hypothetical protein
MKHQQSVTNQKKKTEIKKTIKVSNKTVARASHSINKRLSRKNKCRDSSIKCFNQIPIESASKHTP